MIEVKDNERKKLFYKYVIPSIGAMLVTSLYVVVDGIFVGRGIGAEALASINIAGPYIMAIIAVSMMITVGGATLTAISFGQSREQEANSYFITSMKMIIAFSLLMTVVSICFPHSIARLFGASDILLEDTAIYLRFFVTFGIFFCSSMALAAFVRNDGAPRLAFWGMVVGGVSNIFLDWLFIFPLQMGIMGAAVASGLGQTLACLLLMTHFWHYRGQLRLHNTVFRLATALEIIKRGAPEFMNQLFQPVTVLCYNLLALNIFGEIGVAAFSVVYYILTITVAAFIGLSQGIQPLISRSFGEGNIRNERYYYLKGMGLNLLLAFIVYLLMFVAGRPIIALFNTEPQLIAIGYDCIRIYGLSFIFTAICIVGITYFTATKRTLQALSISALRSLVFVPTFVFLLPTLLGPGAVWSGIVVAEMLAIIVVAWLTWVQIKEQEGDIRATST